MRGHVDAVAPDGVRDFLGELIDAVPDLSFEVVSTTTEGERCGVQWRLRGTFAGPGSLGGVAPTGSPIDLEGLRPADRPRRADRQSNDAFTDTMTFAAPDRA